MMARLEANEWLNSTGRLGHVNVVPIGPKLQTEGYRNYSSE